jgi:DNA-binding PadR family transcriptional regulator
MSLIDMKAASQPGNLTTPDLVLLSVLAERPMHGYDANLQLESRMVGDWAGVSRPQVYYSLDKLSRLELIRPVEGHAPLLGPERRVFATTARGRAALADALEREAWTCRRDRPAFLTWVALSWQARPGIFLKQVGRRETFLQTELQRKQKTLRSIRTEVGHPYHEAVWMVSLTIQQIQVEARWLRKLTREFHHRAPARNPRYVGDK